VAGKIGYDGDQIAAALGRSDGVDVIGEVTDDEREVLFREAACVAVPSFIEGFGIPAGEAMVRGVPVIVATGSGLDEVGEEAALRLAPDDVEGWADALRRIERDLDLRHELRDRGLEAAKGLRWSTAADSYVQLYRALL
jgi:glycosyltransferase involved in cell wall biosynthesis